MRPNWRTKGDGSLGQFKAQKVMGQDVGKQTGANKEVGESWAMGSTC